MPLPGTTASTIHPRIIMLKALWELGTPSTRDQILGRVAVSAREYQIEPEHADAHLRSLNADSMVSKVVTEGATRYRVTGIGLTELGPLAQEQANNADDVGGARDGAPVGV